MTAVAGRGRRRLSTAPSRAVAAGPRRRLAPAAARLAAADQHAHRAAAAVPARPRVGAGRLPAAAPLNPLRVQPVPHRPPDARPAARPAVAVRRVRLALVRRDLPAAVRLPRRLPGPAHPAAPAGAAQPAAGGPGSLRQAAGLATAGRPSSPPEPARAAAAPGARARLADRRARATTLSAEKGYLRETGNLVFHVASSRCWSASRWAACTASRAPCWSWRARASPTRCCPTTTSTPAAASPRTARAVQLRPQRLPRHLHRGRQGADLRREGRLGPRPGGAAPPYDIRVNHPLVVGGAKTYLIGHGYAPHVIVRDAAGHVLDAERALPAAERPVPVHLRHQGAVRPRRRRQRRPAGLRGRLHADHRPGPDAGQVDSVHPAPGQPGADPRRLPRGPRPGQRHPAVGLLARHLRHAAALDGAPQGLLPGRVLAAARRRQPDLRRHRRVGDLPGHPGPGQAAGAGRVGRHRRRPAALAVRAPPPGLGARPPLGRRPGDGALRW